MSTVSALLAQLPPRALFPSQMPRYPNLWFLVDPALVLRRQYQYAVRTLVHALEEDLGLKDTFVQDVQNHALAHLLGQPGEGSDFQARLWPLPPHVDPQDPSRSHGHQVHARFYVSALSDAGAARQAITLGDGAHDVFLIPASVHYEVSTEDPLHPYEDSCPLCGITGEYDVPVDRASEDYCVKIHDPLGLEVLLHGTVRGRPALGDRRAPCVRDLDRRWSCRIEEAFQDEQEPRRLALILLGPHL